MTSRVVDPPPEKVAGTHSIRLPIAVGFWKSAHMKSLTEHLWFEVPDRRGFVNITGTVEELVHKSGIQEGLCLVNA